MCFGVVCCVVLCCFDLFCRLAFVLGKGVGPKKKGSVVGACVSVVLYCRTEQNIAEQNSEGGRRESGLDWTRIVLDLDLRIRTMRARED